MGGLKQIVLAHGCGVKRALYGENSIVPDSIGKHERLGPFRRLLILSCKISDSEDVNPKFIAFKLYAEPPAGQ
jgi:hypothetical protein